MRERLVPNYREKTEKIHEMLETGEVSYDAVWKTFDKMPNLSIWISLTAAPRGGKLFKLLTALLEAKAGLK